MEVSSTHLHIYEGHEDLSQSRMVSLNAICLFAIILFRSMLCIVIHVCIFKIDIKVLNAFLVCLRCSFAAKFLSRIRKHLTNKRETSSEERWLCTQKGFKEMVQFCLWIFQSFNCFGLPELHFGLPELHLGLPELHLGLPEWFMSHKSGNGSVMYMQQYSSQGWAIGEYGGTSEMQKML